MFLETNGDIQLGEITEDDVKAAIRAARSKVSIYRANKDLKNLKPFWTWLKKEKRWKPNPTEDVEKIPGHEPGTKYIPPERDILKVVAAATREERLFLLCYLQTGARKTEIFRLTKKCINNRTFRVGLSV